MDTHVVHVLYYSTAYFLVQRSHPLAKAATTYTGALCCSRHARCILARFEELYEHRISLITSSVLRGCREKVIYQSLEFQQNPSSAGLTGSAVASRMQLAF